MKHFRTAAIGAALAVSIAGQGAACELFHGYQYQMKGGAYELSLNGVHLDSNSEPGDYFGGGPFFLWVVGGENKFAVQMNKGSAEIKVIRGCQGEFAEEVMVETTVNEGEKGELTFFVENAPETVYDDTANTDDGLKEALETLKAAVAARDFDTFWEMHLGLRETAANAGFPVEGLKQMWGQVVAKGETTFTDDVTFKPVLDGRVWQVIGPDGETPISIEFREEDGASFVTSGAYWGKMDGKWSIVGN